MNVIVWLLFMVCYDCIVFVYVVSNLILNVLKFIKLGCVLNVIVEGCGMLGN